MSGRAGRIGVGVALVAAGAVSLLALTRAWQLRPVNAAWTRLAAPAPGGATFDVASVATLPPAAQRFLLHAIAPGTPLATRVELHMRGAIVLGEQRLAMRGHQVLAPGEGFIWKAWSSRGPLRISGYDRYYDGAGEMRWWLLGLVPLITSTGDDVTRSAAGRLGGESVLVPSSLLPGAGAEWSHVDDHNADVRVQVGSERVQYRLTIDDDGRPLRVVIRRWNGDGTNGPIGYMPFVVNFAGEASLGGYTVPTRLEAGWGEARPFFEADVERVVFR